jgi:Leucine-rich repeat (LRR) protein
MKKTILPLAFLLISLLASDQLSAQVNTTDSLALVDLYNSTNGPNWTNHTNWLTSAPVSSWFGVFLNGTQVDVIALQHNNLVGILPSSLGNLTDLPVTIDFSDNRLSGSIPSSYGNLSGSAPSFLLFARNQLSGPLPLFGGFWAPQLDISFNNYTFETIEPFASLGPGNWGIATLFDSVEADLPLIQNGNTLSIAVGGTVSNNTYTWYRNDTMVATKTGDSTFTISGSGMYSVSVTNAAIPSLTLYSIQSINPQDSLALIDLYNSTSGAGWLKNLNWLTAAPISSWNGVECRFGRVQQLYLPYNNLNGPLQSSLGNLQAATVINLSSNQVNGTIPASFGNLQSLAELDLSANELTGVIPSELGSLSNLINLQIDGDQLAGSIPATLGNLVQLTALDLGSNQLSGGIPPELGNLTKLTTLSLNNNQLSDSIPSSVGNLVNLTGLYLNNNQLFGPIPVAIDRLQVVYDLALHDNQLSGAIPDSICRMPQLGRLWLWNNHLTGTIPDSLGNDVTLIDLSVGGNNLSGPIHTNISKTLDSVDIAGNRYNFSVFPLALQAYNTIQYAPQQNIPLTRVEANLSVSAGGNSANSTYTLFKNGASIGTQTGDSSFAILGLGNYNIVTTNTAAPLLTLYSDTLRLGLVLPDSTITTTQTVLADTVTNLESSIFLIASLTPTSGTNALSGSVTALETIDSSIQTFNGLPYVKRHYDISPAANASAAQATVTLYFTQADCDAYNAYVKDSNVGVPLLPTGGIDNGNVIVTQYHGSFTGSSSPGNYSQGSEVIRPFVVWDSVDQWWTVTFSVNGFSGFFLGSSSNPLPLTLLQFSGALRDYEVNLEWLTTGEVNTRQFIVERSPSGGSFVTISTVAAKNASGQNRYGFIDAHPYAGNNFYRLKMQDLSGNFTYSKIVEVTMSTLPAVCLAYPNPATSSTSLLFNATTAAGYNVQISDLRGNVLAHISGTASVGLNKVDIDVHLLAPGTYTIVLTDTEHGRQSIRLLKE